MKKLIINADDFGLSRGINRGIIELFKNGVLTSASLLVNMPGFDDAVRLIKENPSLGVGLHINVLRGKPVSCVEKVGSLCHNGFFHGNSYRLLRLPYTHKRSLDEFEVECRAQIEKAISNGIQITHLDSEKHVHIFRPFFRVLLKTARQYGIFKIRSINEIPYLGQGMGVEKFFKRKFYTAWALSLCSMANKPLLDSYRLKSTDYFYGASAAGHRAGENYARILPHLKDGITELMCHPGNIDEEWQKPPLNQERFYINETRKRELDALLEMGIKGLFKQHGIALMSYGQL